MTEYIELTQGLVAAVDDEDYEELNKYKWYASWNARTFYADRKAPRVKGRQTIIRMHIEIMKLHGLYEPGKQVNHKDKDGLNNQRYNLEMVTYTQHGNVHRDTIRSNNASGYPGVGWDTTHQKWNSRASVDGYRHTIGYFDDKLVASLARQVFLFRIEHPEAFDPANY